MAQQDETAPRMPASNPKNVKYLAVSFPLKVKIEAFAKELDVSQNDIMNELMQAGLSTKDFREYRKRMIQEKLNRAETDQDQVGS